MSRLSLNTLSDPPVRTLADDLACARRLVSDRVGIMAAVRSAGLAADDPTVHSIRSIAAKRLPLTGRPVRYHGHASSVDLERATMKAVGEGIERYCASVHDESRLTLGTYEDLDGDAVAPDKWCLFTPQDYTEPGFPFVPITRRTPLHWILGHSLGADRPTYVPAAFVYVPYYTDDFDIGPEQPIWTTVSTGLACGRTRAAALYRGVLEVIERDAFMIVWRNRLSLPVINLETVPDSLARRLINAIDPLPVRYQAVLLTLDIAVVVILVILSSQNGIAPFTVVGAAADLDPSHALALALEEACLSWSGLRRAVAQSKDYSSEPAYRNVNSLEMHGLAHAVDPTLPPQTAFLTAGPEISFDCLPQPNATSTVEALRILVEQLASLNSDVVAVDLTTRDVDDAGFSVVRAMIPGFQPLDVDHARQYDGPRLHEVPSKLGFSGGHSLVSDSIRYPHPFA